MFTLDQSRTEELRRTGPYGDGQLWHVGPDQVRYGTPLKELLEASDHHLGAFLEAAAVAGHTAPVHEGLLMTLRAFAAWVEQEATRNTRGGADGDALADLEATANYLRTVSAVAEGLSASLEGRAAVIWRRHPNERVPSEARREWRLRAKNCDDRARRSYERQAEARRDRNVEPC